MMELRSTGNPDISNPVTMSMLEYLAKKGREAMSGKMTFGDKIRGMNDEELVEFLSEFMICKFCECYDEELERCWKEDDFMCIKETIIRDWLKQPVED